MIDWLAQSYASAPGCLAGGVPPSGLLNPLEEGQLALLKTDKRRREWLLGRWTAKKLLQASLWRSTGVFRPYAALVVRNDAARRPYATWESALGSWVAPFQLSISHSGAYAFCAVTSVAGWSIGADVEQVMHRPDGFVEEYFTPEEADWVNHGPERSRDTRISAVWSAKEAVLKALGLGLSVDTRSLTCLLSAPAGLPGAWATFAVRFPVSSELPGKTFQDPAGTGGQYSGWWRAVSGYVFTMAVRSLAGY